jgi:hypothetical protein
LIVLIVVFLSIVSTKTPGGVEPPYRALQARASPFGHGVAMKPPRGFEPLRPGSKPGALVH